MDNYPRHMTTDEYFGTDCYKAAIYAYSQSWPHGSSKSRQPIAPTLWDITEDAAAVGCLPVIEYVPRDEALAILDPVFEAADAPKPSH